MTTDDRPIPEPVPADMGSRGEEHRDPRHHFHQALDDLRLGMVRMGSLVLENMRRAGEAMLEGRLDLVPEVRAADEAVNELYYQLEYRTFELLARQQPMARDLRFLVSATRILYEIERSGDLAVNCVNMLERQDGFPSRPRLLSLLSQLVDASARVFAMSLDALADMTEDAGYRLDEADDEVDDLVSLYYTEIGRMSDEIGLEAAIAMSRVGRFLERIADHGVNIGENVTYIITGEFPDRRPPEVDDEIET